MGAIFQSLGRTVAAGIVLLIVLVALVVGTTGAPIRVDHAWAAFFMRWLHVLSGVMWIGLLWYFNFVQIPSMPKIPDEQKPAIGKVIAPT
ncbi:MAG TPA: urate hydroxylase PuuD, partial [Burkholderiaceae bacterium]|nr:urate hydroxylase PuuD [Burkholderiaceae bacterium]